MSSPPLKIAIVGLGTVGTGVARILSEHPERLALRTGRQVEIRQAIVRDISKVRDIDLPADVITDDLNSVVNDNEIDVAIQLIGGVSPAREIMLSLLESGKDIVTANKALMCEHGDELFRRARELGRTIAFEAAVAGGVPIIATVGQSMSANQITSIEAILNGTSNYILTEMLSRNLSYATVLKEAQDLGYAEADPSMDIDGTDAAQKLVILAQLAFGTRVPLTEFPRQGLDTLTLADLKYADELGYTVKLLAVARMIENDLEMHVQPTLVRHGRPLAQVDGPYNMIALEGDAVGRTWYSGPGAGQMATASAVVADLVDMAVGRSQLTFNQLDIWREASPMGVQPAEEISRRYYLRFNVEDRPHVLADISDILGRNEISIASLIQHEAPEVELGEEDSEAIVPLVIMTHRTTEGQIRASAKELEKLSALRPPNIIMPVAD